MLTYRILVLYLNHQPNERSKMYEWETKLDKSAIQIRIVALQKETSRIANVVLRGNFVNPDDLTYWQKRLKKLNGELSGLEQMLKPKY